MTSNNSEITAGDPVGGRPWDVAAETASLQLVYLVPLGLLLLVAWFFGQLHDALKPLTMVVVVGASQPVVDLCRKRPRGWRSGIATVFAIVVGLSVLGSMLGAQISTSGEDFGDSLGSMAGLPIGAAVLAWRVNRASTTPSGA
ncbi:hypothetical protein ACFZAU_14345 [Streptomyces sp. NPDC008238]